MTKLLTFLWVILGPSVLFAQVQVTADTTHIRIGEQITYKLSTENSPDVVFQKLVLDSLNKIEIVKEFPIDTLKDRLYKKYLLTSFDSGSYNIPKQEILIKGQHYFTDSLLIHVGTVAVDTTKQGLFPIKNIYQAPPKTWHEYVHFLWWALGLLLLAFLIWWFAFKDKKVLNRKSQKDLTPYELALNYLKLLDEKNLISRHKIKEYYSELSDILRNYLEKDTRISAMEVTTDELLILIKAYNKQKKLEIPSEEIAVFEHLLKTADLVKFAKAKPENTEIQADRRVAEKLLQVFQTVLNKPVDPEDAENESYILEQKLLQKTKKQKLIGIGIGVAIVLMVMVGSVWFYGYTYLKDTVLGHPSKELLEGTWYYNSYGYPAVHIESPKILKAQPLNIPPEAQSVMKSQASFGYGSLQGGFYVMVMTSEFNEQVQLDLEGAVQGAVQMVASQEGVSDLTYDSDEVTIDGVSGKELNGQLLVHGQTMLFVQYIMLHENSMQQIVILRKKQDIYAEKITNRMVNSIGLERN